MSGPIIVSQSRMRDLRACPERFRLTHELDRAPAPAGGRMASDDFGKRTHRALQALYEGLRRRWPGGAILACMEAEIDASGVDHKGDRYEAPRDPMERAVLRALARAYVEVYGEHDAATYEVLAVERSFSLPALRPDGRPRAATIVEGQIDLVVRERETGRVLVSDHKTTESDFTRDFYWAGVEMRPQVDLYLDAAIRMGHEPAAFLYNVLRRPGKMRAEQPIAGELPLEYEERLYRLITAERNRYFARLEITREPWQLMRGRREVIATAREIAHRRQYGDWPTNSDACKSFGGCPWMRVCTGKAREDDDSLYPKRVREKEGEEKVKKTEQTPKIEEAAR